ncbi:MAG: hypothetical protein JOZ70_10530 [Pseudolabrys sp.]|nr:hypothetical protein [Pseudolabrys sp.]
MRVTCLILAGALACFTTAPAAAEFDLSAQQQKCPKGGCKQRAAPRALPAPAARPAPRMVQPRVQQRTVQPRPPQRTVQPRQVQPRVQQRTVTQQRTVRSTTRVTTRAQTRTMNFRPNRSTYAVRIRTGNRYSYQGRNYSMWRTGPWRHRYGNRWRTYVALTTLGAIAVGTATYYPYAYIDAPADACEGVTEDGCQLVYDEVETLEGGLAPVCVAYCPQ